LVNGAAGLALVPPPLSDRFDPNTENYQYFYVGLTTVCVALVALVASRIVNSPYGRSLRAMREHEVAATAIGKNPVELKMTVFIVGGVIGGLSGAILVGFIQFWSPATWLYPETIILFAAVIVGGRGNNLGAILGALLVPVGFEEATRFIPTTIGPPGMIPALQWVVIGLLIIGFLWFRPEGVRPEPRHIFEGAPVADDREDVHAA
jgi:branched-chain amino acid transport system permease protein